MFIFKQRFRRYSKLSSSLVKYVIRHTSEPKYYVVRRGDSFVAQYGYSYPISPQIASGVGTFNRIGNLIQYKFLKLDLILTSSMSIPPTLPGMSVRVLLVQPRTSDTTALIPSQASWLFDNNDNGSIAIGQAIVSPIHNQNARVLFDKTFMMGAYDSTGLYPASGVELPSLKSLKIRCPLNNKVEYRAGNLLNPEFKDQYHLFVVTDAVGAGYSFGITFCCRISYTDI